VATISERDDALVTTFGRLLEARSTLERRLGAELEARCELPLAWFEVLVRLARSEHEQLTMSSLAEQVSVTTSGITRLVDRMAAADLVERVPSPTDRRISYVRLTAAGRDGLDKALPVHAAGLREIFTSFSDADRCTFDALLDRLRPGSSGDRCPEGVRTDS
jgi:MarR family transcriptional regulator, 2-MHQ and catechol-resistance regulon repressor